MPRAFDDKQAGRLREQLISVAEQQFTQLGYDRTSVDELVREIGISKGSFYRFFATKDDLFLEVLSVVEGRCRDQISAAITGARKRGANEFATFIKTVGQSLQNEPFLRHVHDREFLKGLVARVDPQRLAAHQADDWKFYRRIFSDWIERGVVRNVKLPDLDSIVVTRLLIAQGRETYGKNYARAVRFFEEAVTSFVTGPD